MLSVSQFIEATNVILAERAFPAGVFVEGEVTGFKGITQGKWLWFKLKDEAGVIECFSTVWKVRQPIEDGMKVRIHGGPKVFNRSGKFVIDVDALEPVGEGALRRAFELLKKKLEADGLFAPERKRPLPRFPDRIGLIASASSDAYADFLKILGNRWGGVHVHAANVQVQGREAVPTIVGAFRYFNAHPEAAEVLVLTRGGGSLDDLHAFNSEEVARAIFASRIPVIVGVGHERDESLADFVADVRASTPSNAAERLVPDRRDVDRDLAAKASFMEGALKEELAGRKHHLLEVESVLQGHVRAAREEFDAVTADLQRQLAAFEGHVLKLSASVTGQERVLKSLDPQGVLKRGYSIVRDAGGRLLRDAASVDKGAAIAVQLAKGKLEAEVTAVTPSS